MQLLKQLTETAGIAGREHRVRELIIKETQGLFDETRVDPMGSLICHRKPRPARAGGKSIKPLRIMLAAHMDQIGFIVRHIDDKGFLRLNPVGGFDARTLFARTVTICTDDGDLPGVMNPSTKPIHVASEEDRKKIPETGDFMVDLGLPGKQVKKKVKIGDMVVIQAPMLEVGDTIVGQAMDNRIACWTAIRSLQKLSHHNCDIFCVFTVQEEVGLRGAMTAAYDVKPDVGISIDVTLCVDTPGVGEDQRISAQGEGAAITLMDSSCISDLDLVRQFESIASRKRIKSQRSILSRGGNDAGALQRAASGTKAFTLACPTRYVHTVTEMVHKTDLFACRDLLAAYLMEA